MEGAFIAALYSYCTVAGRMSERAHYVKEAIESGDDNKGDLTIKGSPRSTVQYSALCSFCPAKITVYLSHVGREGETKAKEGPFIYKIIFALVFVLNVQIYLVCPVIWVCHDRGTIGK